MSTRKKVDIIEIQFVGNANYQILILKRSRIQIVNERKVK
jgi:hypothetical protein